MFRYCFADSSASFLPVDTLLFEEYELIVLLGFVDEDAVELLILESSRVGVVVLGSEFVGVPVQPARTTRQIITRRDKYFLNILRSPFN